MSTKRSELLHRVESALEQGRSALETLQSTTTGGFDLGFDGGALPDAHIVFVESVLGITEQSELFSPRLMRRLLDRQLPEGGWSLAPGEGVHLSTTVEAYIALRSGGMDPHERPLVRARHLIIDKGGLEEVRGPTQITLALLGLFPWPDTLIPPPEIALLPPEAPVSLFRVGALLRLHLLPLIVLRAAEAVIAPALGRSLGRELGGSRCHTQIERPGPLQREGLDACLSLMVERLDEDGSLGGLLLATGWAAIAARVQRLPGSHPLLVEPVKGLLSFVFQPEDREIHVQVCRPTVRATAIGLQALCAAGGSKEAIDGSSAYIMSHRAGEHGDFELLGPPGPALAWAIKPCSSRFPNLMDTLHVVTAFAGLDTFEKEAYRALEWVKKMQRPDGGFPLFERDGTTAPWFKRLPFGLLTHTLNDESSPEVTGKALEVSHRLPFFRGRELDGALGFLYRSQRSDGSWQGPFSFGYLPTTCAALAGLAARGPRASGTLRKAVDFVLRWQRPEGGWGESSRSVSEGGYVDLGRCSPTQTARAMLGLLALPSPPSSVIERALEYLLWTQEPDGSWIDDDPSSASLTDLLHLSSPVEAIAKPLLALRAYLERSPHGRRFG